MKKQLLFSCILLASAPVFASHAPAPEATDVAQQCTCGEGCDCLANNEVCPCDTTKSEEREEREGGCGGFCGRSVQVCDAGACE